MIEIQWNSPFGARPISAALIRREVGVRHAQARLRADASAAEEDASGEGPDKWVLLRALTEARGHFGLSDRTLAVLEALLSCQAGKRIDPSRPQIVFPSNRELSLRTRGMADATLRRHLASLVEAGLLFRRDSPNGKRYRRRDPEDGEEAFGFDLSPFALCADLIMTAAEDARAQARAIRHLKTSIALCRRDIRKILDAALVEERPGDWAPLERAWLHVARPLPRSVLADELTIRLRECVELRAQAETLYLSTLSEQEMSGNDEQNERHYQNSKTENKIEVSTESQNEAESSFLRSTDDSVSRSKPDPVTQRLASEDASKPIAQHKRDGLTEPADGNVALRSKSDLDAPDLPTVLAICPGLSDYSLTPIRSVAEFEATANVVRGFLGISADAYRAAQSAMGSFEAAVTIAALLERADRVRSPGGYLRALTAKAGARRFRLGPMLEALRNEALRH